MPDHRNYALTPESFMADTTMPEELAGIPPEMSLSAALDAVPLSPDPEAPSPAPGQIDEGNIRDSILPLEQVERQAIENAIRICGGNVLRAAALLRISPSTIYRKKAGWRAAPTLGTGQGKPQEKA